MTNTARAAVVVNGTFFTFSSHSEDRIFERGTELENGVISHKLIGDVIKYGACYKSMWDKDALVLTAKLIKPVFYQADFKHFVFVVIKPCETGWYIITSCYTNPSERSRSGIGAKYDRPLPWRAQYPIAA